MTVTLTLILFGMVLLSWNIGRIILPFGITFLRHHSLITKNYLGHHIPNSYGIVLLFAFMGIYGLMSPFFLFERFSVGEETLFWAVGVASVWMVLLGWLDDTLGDHDAKGFRGHFQVLKREGVLTTGLLKAGGGGATACLVAFITSQTVAEWVVHALLIALATNWLNLLDLRPGRASKFYLFATVLLCAAAWPQPFVLIFLPLFFLVGVTLKADLQAKLMLGDSGANLLGMQLGILSAVALPLSACITITGFLLVGHIYAERRSLTDLITRVRWLEKLDSWGRVES